MVSNNEHADSSDHPIDSLHTYMIGPMRIDFASDQLPRFNQICIYI